MEFPEDITKLLQCKFDQICNSNFVKAFGDQAKTDVVEHVACLGIRAAGVSVTATLEGHVEAIHLYSEGFKKHREFGGVLPHGISFQNGREEIRANLGIPALSGGGDVVPVLGAIPLWDRFKMSGYDLHVQYTDDCLGVSLVTLMPS